ncbi:MAG: alpha/beta hydrolase-fold protein [Gemmatimonadaceae bacterium]
MPSSVSVQEALRDERQRRGRASLQMRSGGYARFMEFLRDELLPSVAARFPIDTAARHMLVGHSSGGHFARPPKVDLAATRRAKA